MTRGVGVAEWLADLPDVLVVGAALLTQLGDLWFLILVVATLYWLGPATPVLGDAVDRERVLAVAGLLFLGIALTVTLKAVVALPRPPWFVADPTVAGLAGPPATAFAWLAGAEGYGFPSGHAIAATVGWGGLAWAVRAGRRRRRVALAALVVANVSLTRLVLGVHYLVDVVAGVVVGLAALSVLSHGRRQSLAFALAIVVGLVGVAVAGLTTDAAAATGLPLGAAAAWVAGGRDAVGAGRGRRAGTVTAALGIGLVLPALALAVVGPVPPAATLPVATVVGGALIALPLVGDRVEKIVFG